MSFQVNIYHHNDNRHDAEVKQSYLCLVIARKGGSD
jgi:hypothetical protein